MSEPQGKGAGHTQSRHACWAVICSRPAVMQKRRSEGSQYGIAVAQRLADEFSLDEIRTRYAVDEDAVVGRIDMVFDRCDESAVLGFGQFTLEDAALHPVEILSAYLEDAGVAFGEGVIDEDNEHLSPPGVEGLVRRAFEAEPYEFEGFKVDEFFVGNFAA